MENGTTTDNRKAAADAKSAPPAGQHSLSKRTLYLLIAFAGMLAAKLFFDFAFSGSRAPRAPPPPKKTPPPPPPAGGAHTPPPAAEPPLLVLNGTLLSDGEKFAIINNQIVKMGDEIDGAVVKRITVNAVELEFAGKPLSITSAEN